MESESPFQQGEIDYAKAAELLSQMLHEEAMLARRVEGFVAASAMTMFLLIILSPWRRWSSNSSIHGVVWLAYTLSFPLVTYTLGLMQYSSVKTLFFPIWATSLFLVSGCTNSMTVYDLDENKQWMRHLFELLQHYFYFMQMSKMFPYVMFHGHEVKTIFATCSALAFIVLSSNILRVKAGWMVNYSYQSKVVADYMRDHSKQQYLQQIDPVSMKGCKYLVRWHDYMVSWNGNSTNSSKHPEEDIITIEMIWEKCNLSSSKDGDTRLKDVCLSFALSHLLKRRFFGMDCAEASLQQTSEFVLEGLLSNDSNNYARAFSIIEVELSFLYDFFFTKYACIFQSDISSFAMVVLKITSTSVLLVLFFFKRPTIDMPSEFPVSLTDMETDESTIDVQVIVILILATFLIMETLQFLFYLGSDWAIISFACNHTRARRFRSIYKHFHCLTRFRFSRSWQDKIGQYSVVRGCWTFPPISGMFEHLFNLGYNRTLTQREKVPLKKKITGMIHSHSFPRKSLHHVKLPGVVKSQIVSTLKSSISRKYLSNGKDSLEQNGVLEMFNWTFQRPTHEETMLIWHIATDYCEIATSAEPDAQHATEQYQYREVATTLSRYCISLMYSAPELLPGNYADTRVTFHSTVLGAKWAMLESATDEGETGERKTKGQRLQEAIRSCSKIERETIFVSGARLGTDLEDMEDGHLRWKVMADFWVETTLYIAPSDNVKAHMQCLAKGGQFLTHIWTILSHAGILSRDQGRRTPEENV